MLDTYFGEADAEDAVIAPTANADGTYSFGFNGGSAGGVMLS